MMVCVVAADMVPPYESKSKTLFQRLRFETPPLKRFSFRRIVVEKKGKRQWDE
jgi:hypothetical protein